MSEPQRDRRPWDRLAALLLLILPAVIFWRDGFFYILDDWTALIHLTQHPFGEYLILPDGEQWFPLFHVVYYGLVRLAGERYTLLVGLNCLGTGLNAWLLYLFFRRHWAPGLSFSLSLLYAAAALHHAIAWNAFYVGYLISLAGFLGALLLTDSYCRQGGAGRLAGIAGLALAAVLCHNYPLVGLLALPLYALLMGPEAAGGRKAALPVMGMVFLAWLFFALGYVIFAGAGATTSHNRDLWAGLPGAGYWVHMFYGAVLSPFLYLFWGHYHFPVWTYVAGGAALAGCLAIIWRWGSPAERRLALWALAANALPFVLISLTRYQRSLTQAFVARYGIFTLLGALLLAGAAWRLAAARLTPPWRRALGLGLMGAVLAGQFLSLPLWESKYREMSRAARYGYETLGRPDLPPQSAPPVEFQKFCPTAFPSLSPAQVQAIRQFFRGQDNLGIGSVRPGPEKNLR
jgi:hypothetical protein